MSAAFGYLAFVFSAVPEADFKMFFLFLMLTLNVVGISMTEYRVVDSYLRERYQVFVPSSISASPICSCCIHTHTQVPHPRLGTTFLTPPCSHPRRCTHAFLTTHLRFSPVASPPCFKGTLKHSLYTLGIWFMHILNKFTAFP